MNWYKKALKINDIYNLYALQGLPNEALMERSDFLYDLIRIINELREEYLGILKAALSYHFIDNYYFKEVVEEYTSEKFPEISNFNVQELDGLTRYIAKYPKILNWPWIQVFYWTIKLIKTEPLPYPKAISLDFIQKLRSVVVLIDTIHSLEHENGDLLSDYNLENSTQISAILPIVLEIISKIVSPSSLARISKNKDLLKYYRELNFKSPPREDMEELYYQSMLKQFKSNYMWIEDMPPFEDLYELAQKTNDLDLYNAIKRVEKDYEEETINY